MNKHTPGPWMAVGAWVEHPDDEVADICVCDTMLFSQGHFNRSEEEECANARLIAAAPELLEALKKLMKDAGGEDLVKWKIAHEAARAAIAKATGGEE